jgi:hypothetical protein
VLTPEKRRTLESTTVLLTMKDLEGARLRMATGFLFGYEHAGRTTPFLVTAASALKGADAVVVDGYATSSGERTRFSVSIKRLEDSFIHHPDPRVQLCGFEFGPLYHYLSDKGKTPVMQVVSEEMVPRHAEWQATTTGSDVIVIAHLAYSVLHGGAQTTLNAQLLTEPTDVNGGRFSIALDGEPDLLGAPVFRLHKGLYSTPTAELCEGKGLLLLGNVVSLTLRGDGGQGVAECWWSASLRTLLEAVQKQHRMPPRSDAGAARR